MKAQTVLRQLEQAIGLNGPPQRLVSAIESELVATFGVAPLAAAEQAEKIAPAVGRLIEAQSTEADEHGTMSVLVLIGTTNDTVVGSCHALPTDLAPHRALKNQRLNAEQLHAAMKALSFGDFEKFGARVLRELGATYVKVTPHAGDQGIDFYGYLSVGALQQLPVPFFKLAHEVRLAFAGQAKHYPSRAVGTATVRELVGAVELAKVGAFSSDDPDLFEGLDLKPFAPVLPLLFSTGPMSSGAYSLGAAAGIIVKSGEQLAIFLADRGVGMSTEEDGSLSFSAVAFLAWLNA